MAARLAADPALVDAVMKEISKLDLDSITSKRFQKLKMRSLIVDSVLGQGNEFSDEQVESLIGLILTPSGGFWDGYRKIIAAASSSSLRSRLTGVMTRIGDWVSLRGPVEGSRAHQASLNRPPLSDCDYLNFLVQLKADRPAFGRVIGEIFAIAQQHIAARLSIALQGRLPSRLQHDMNERERNDLAAKCQQLADAEEERSWQSLKDQLIQELRARNEQYVPIYIHPSLTPVTHVYRSTLIIKQVRKVEQYGSSSMYYLALFRFVPFLSRPSLVRVHAQQQRLESALYRYTFHRFMVTNDDKILASNDPHHICHPKIHPSLKPTFELPTSSSIK